MAIWEWLFGGGRSETLRDRIGGRSTAPPEERGPSGGVAVLEAPPDAAPPASPAWWVPPGAIAGDPPDLPRPDLSAEAAAIEYIIIANFDGHDLVMPSMPRVAERVLAALHDPECQVEPLAQLASEDQVLAAALIRTANSPLYRGVHRTESLEKAITRIGLNTLRTIVLHQSMRTVLFPRKGIDRTLAERIWRRSLAAGAIMRRLAPLASIDPDEAFLFGLLHDIGSVVVVRIIHTNYEKTQWMVDVETGEYLCWEAHQEFGELIAQAWNLPGRLRALITEHHALPTSDAPLRRERLLLQLTERICALLGYAPLTTPFDLLATSAVRELGWTDSPQFAALLESLPEAILETVSVD